MNILYVTSENIYGTGSSNLRNISVIEGFVSLGNHVSILSMEPDEEAKTYDKGIKARLEGIQCYFLKNNSLQKVFAVKKASRNTAFSQIKKYIYKTIKQVYLRFSPDTLIQAVNNVDRNLFPKEQFDIVISSSDPVSSHQLAKLFLSSSHQHNSRWIQYWGDPLFLDITRNVANRKKLKSIEGRFLKDANRVVYTNPLVLNEQMRLYPSCSNKMISVPTPFSFIKEIKNEDIEFEIGYFGSYMSCVRDIMPLCESAISNNLRLIVMGGGDQTIPKHDLISVWSFQDTKTVSEYEAKTRVLVCLCNKSKTGEKVLQIPGKVYHYAMTYKPIIIVGADKTTRLYLEQYKRYYFADNTAESIYNTFKIIFDGGIETVINEPVNAFKNYVVAKQIIE